MGYHEWVNGMGLLLAHGVTAVLAVVRDRLKALRDRQNREGDVKRIWSPEDFAALSAARERHPAYVMSALQEAVESSPPEYEQPCEIVDLRTRKRVVVTDEPLCQCGCRLSFHERDPRAETPLLANWPCQQCDQCPDFVEVQTETLFDPEPS
jgi:hypothetical protein